MKNTKSIIESIGSINESFLTPLLSQINSHVKKLRDKDGSRVLYGGTTFAKIMQHTPYSCIRWDKITDSDIDRMTPSTSKTDRRYIYQKVTTGRNIIFCREFDADGKPGEWVGVCAAGKYYPFTNPYQYMQKQMEVVNKLCSMCELAIIGVTEEMRSEPEVIDRRIANSGSIPSDPEERDAYYKELLQNQRKRYQDTVEKMRTLKDTWLEKAMPRIEKIVNRYFKISMGVNANLEKYAGSSYEFDKISKLVSNERGYAGTRGGTAIYTGNHSLMSMLRTYTEARMDKANMKSYGPSVSDIEKMRDDITLIADKAEKLMDEFEKKASSKHE